MARNYVYEEINISSLVLDDENPRFASSILVQDNTKKVTQDAIIIHLLKYADIIKLANRINTVKELHGSELITCYKRGNEYVVLEGNRRTCACKLLLNPTLVPEEYKSKFPFANEETKENIKRIFINVYPSREAVQAYLSDRHIAGVKTWSALEKNNYYMNLFETYNNIDKIQEFTSDTLATIKKCIKKYQFFMDVFNVLKIKHSNIEIEKLDYLPMVDRFMETLVGDDKDVGLNLNFDEYNQKYQCEDSRLGKYNEILILVGEAFLVRNEKKHCEDNELSKVVGSEISTIKNQRELILKDKRIPGLLDLINEYKAIGSSKNTVSSLENEREKDDIEQNNHAKSSNSDISSTNCISDNEKVIDSLPNEESGNVTNNGFKGKEIISGDLGSEETKDSKESQKYIPQVKYIPRKTKMEFLSFTEQEAKKFKISSNSDYEIKIISIMHDLSNFSIYRHPYTCALLYRTLLEICTKMIYDKCKSKISREYNENNLVGNMQYLNNSYLFANKNGKDIPKIKLAIKNNLSDCDLIQILNLYIHYSNPVDVELLLSSWNSMKFYIQACLEI